MTDIVDDIVNKFASEARDFHSGERTEYPELLSDPLFIDPRRSPPQQDKDTRYAS